jgi:hypothetical protein
MSINDEDWIDSHIFFNKNHKVTYQHVISNAFSGSFCVESQQNTSISSEIIDDTMLLFTEQILMDMKNEDLNDIC